MNVDTRFGETWLLSSGLKIKPRKKEHEEGSQQSLLDISLKLVFFSWLSLPP
jgi:hypothetical protein